MNMKPISGVLISLAFVFAGPIFAQETVSLADYYPIDPKAHCTKTFQQTFGGVAQLTSIVVGTTTVPYTSGAISGALICNGMPEESPNSLLGASNDGVTVRLLSLGSWYASADCALSAPPAAVSWSTVQDGMVVGPQTFDMVKRDLSDCQSNEYSAYLVDIQDISVLEGLYEKSVIMWGLDPNHSFSPLDLKGKELDLGIVLPNSSDTGGISITGFSAHGLGRGLILEGDISAATGELNSLIELASVSCKGANYEAFDIPASMLTRAWGGNDRGDIVGFYLGSSGHYRGFLRRKGVFSTIDFPGAIATRALDMNNLGDVVGSYRATDGAIHGFLFARGVFTSIDFTGATETEAVSLNNRGDIVGLYRTSDGVEHGFLLAKGVFHTVDFPGSSRTYALGINDGGDVVGLYSYGTGPAHGYLFTDGAFDPIDVPGAFITQARGINRRGDIVGSYNTEPGGSLRGFLLSRGVFSTIEVPCAEVTRLHEINNHGEIIGDFIDGDQVVYGFSTSP